MRDWKGKLIVIVGAARQGLALARYLLLHGAQVRLTDRQPASALAAAQEALADLVDAGLPLTWVCGGHPLDLLDGADVVCVSGGVPLNLPLLVAARERHIPLTNDSQIFMQAVPCKVIGITGSAGKTTTTTLVGRIAQAGYSTGRVWVGGNIGSPLISVLDEMSSADLAVVEFSSFQLELMDCSPDIAVVLNITPNHLDRHGSMEAYAAAKARLLQFQDEQGLVVLGRDDPGAWALHSMARGQVFSFGLSPLPDGQLGAFADQSAVYLRLPAVASTALQPVAVLQRSQIALRGEHNLLNVMAACAVAGAAGLPLEAIQKGIQGFGGVPHRLEFVRSWGGADWYNDSIATAPERAMADIRSFDEPLVLLAGGRDKDLPWEDFAALVHRRVDHLIVFGEAAPKILRAVGDSGQPTITRCNGLQEAVRAAAQIVQPGDVVLLAPGGTSFDEFKDFEERGRYFAQWVRELP